MACNISVNALVIPGMYCNRDGDLFNVLFNAELIEDTESLGNTVVYMAMATGEIFVRSISEWTELVQWPDGNYHRRFIATTDTPRDLWHPKSVHSNNTPCKTHPKYKAIREPTSSCAACYKIWVRKELAHG
jgi:hypothetical protein